MDQEHKEALQNATNEGSTEQTLPPRPEVSRCANISIVFIVISVCAFTLLFAGERNWNLAALCFLISVICMGISGIFGIIGIISILLSKGKRCGLKRSVVALLLTTFGLWLGVSLILIYSDLTTRMHSAARMRGLGNTLFMYQNYYGCMPKEQWCDLLFQLNEYADRKRFTPVEKRDFCSPAAKSGECHYAFNKHLIGYSTDAPAEVVVLFESKHAGWNQIGGPELMTTTEYQPGSWLYLRLAKATGVKNLGRGCYVCFGNGHVEFVKPEEYE